MALYSNPASASSLGVVDVATVDDEGVLHGLFHHAEARHAELLPFGDEQQSVCVEQGFVHVIAINDLLYDCRGIGAPSHSALAKTTPSCSRSSRQS